MICGIGVDICQVSRLESFPLEGRFARRFFSREELAYLESKGSARAQSMAGLYAAKEAFSKVLGSGVRGFELKEVEVIHTPEGRPCYRISGKALEAMKQRGIEEVLLSISHDAGVAAAFALGQKSDNKEEL